MGKYKFPCKHTSDNAFIECLPVKVVASLFADTKDHYYLEISELEATFTENQLRSDLFKKDSSVEKNVRVICPVCKAGCRSVEVTIEPSCYRCKTEKDVIHCPHNRAYSCKKCLGYLCGACTRNHDK